MQNQEVLQNPLAVDSVWKLLGKYAIPCVISLLVNSLYNMVDQIFIGQGVGYLGNGTTNIIYPLTVIVLSIALMLGDGGASFLREKRRRGKRDWQCHHIFCCGGVYHCCSDGCFSGGSCLSVWVHRNPLSLCHGLWQDYHHRFAFCFGRNGFYCH